MVSFSWRDLGDWPLAIGVYRRVSVEMAMDVVGWRKGLVEGD